MPVIVDTNVLIVANGRVTAHLPPPGCTAAAARRLLTITQSEIVVIDNKWLIINEYKKKNFPSNGHRKAGEEFLLWLLRNNSSPKCRQVDLDVIDAETHDYLIFPVDSKLAAFDPADRKFVAVALTHSHEYSGEIPSILNATDSDWVLHEAALNAHGLTIEFLCGKTLKISAP